MKGLNISWERAWRGVGAHGDGLECRDSLIVAYQESHRHYHTLQHLEECLQLLSQYRDFVEHSAELEVALWFHDAVYEVKGHDNEWQSAQWAMRALSEAGVDAARVARVESLILATQHQEIPKDLDSQWMVDIDLAILGAEPVRFEDYERQIRKE